MLEVLRATDGSARSLDMVRLKFSSVPMPTWYKWRVEAIKRYQAEGGNFTDDQPVITQPKSKAGKARTAKAAEPKQQQPKPKPKPLEGDVESPPDAPMTTPEGAQVYGLGVAKDGLYIIPGMFPRESSIVTRWTDPPDPNAPLPIIDELKKLYLSAGAVLDSQIKRVGDGHAILDGKVVLEAIEIQRKAMMDILKSIERSRNMDSLEKFCAAVMAIIQRMAPDQAKVMLAAMREAATPFSSRQWQASIPQPVA